MLRSAASKVVWLGRATVFFVGLAVLLALVFGAASVALGADGDFFKVGRSNLATAVSVLTKRGAGPALDLRVGSGPPLKVNSQTRVESLNADQLDGKDFGAFGADGVIDTIGPLPVQGSLTSKGGTLILSVSGSGFRRTGNSQLEGLIGMDVQLDGGFQGVLGVYTNERNSHKAFVSKDLVVRGCSAGEHTIRLGRIYAAVACNTANETKGDYCTDTDASDRFHVTVTEIPD